MNLENAWKCGVGTVATVALQKIKATIDMEIECSMEVTMSWATVGRLAHADTGATGWAVN